MTLEEANDYLAEVHGKGYAFLEQWGLSIIRESIRTVYSRKSAADDMLARAEAVESVVLSKGRY